MCLLFITTVASAQISRISGTVSDDFDVLPGAAVQEIDGTNRIVNATVTDANGNFTMSVKSTKNKLKISFMGYKTQMLAINKTVFKVKMADNTVTMKDVNITAKKMMKTSGLAIPEREVSYAAQGLDAKEFEGLGITSVDEALQGRIAGLDIVANSGDLGAGTQMRLRGASTISTLTSNEPLIVVNGQIATDIDQTDFDVATANEEKFAELLKVNPEDIQDIKVLKDASATAIWGNRGANGVIEITTKRGKVGPTRISYSGKFTVTHQPEAIKLLNGDQYTMMLKEAYFNPKLSDTDGDIPELNYDYDKFSEAYMYDNNTDWVGLVRQIGFNQSHNINLIGGDEKTQFRISGGFDHQTGTVIKQKLDRFTTRMALDYKVSDRIKIISNFALTYTDNARNYDGLISNAYQKMPNLSPYYEYENGVQSNDYYFMRQDAGGANRRLQSQVGMPNLLASAELAKYSQRNYSMSPELELEYKLLGLDNEHHQLRYNGNVYVNISNAYDDKDYPRELSTASYIDTHTAYSYSAKSLSFTTRHSLTFQPHFNNQDHYLNAMARFELTSGSNSSQSTNAKRLPTGVSSPSAGGIISGMSSGFSQWRSMAGLITAHYSYKGRYAVTGTVRLDGTTKLGPSKRWNPAYSISGRWNISDEPFMRWAKETLKVSTLGFSPGWGIVYNLPGGDYLYMNKYSTGKSYNGLVSMNASSMKMTNFTAEKVNSWNFGINLGLFDERLTLRLDIYDRITTDMLMGNAGLSTATGWSSLPYKNVGSMDNRGWEFNINGNRLFKKDKFSMDAYVNFNNNYNLIKSMDVNVLEDLNKEFGRKNRDLLQRVQINNPFGAIYGFRSKGIYQYNYSTAKQMAKTAEGRAELQAQIDRGITYPVALSETNQVVYDEKGVPLQMKFCYEEGDQLLNFNGGDAIYEDVNHDGQINELDIVYLGSSLPKLTGGFGLTFNYGRWRLSSQFNYRVDIDVFNMGRLDNESMNENINQSQAVNYRWRKEGDVTSIPRALSSALATNYNTLVSDRFIEDASFLRLNFLQLSYSFDNKLTKKWGINSLRLSASAQNLFVLTRYTGMDPEIGYGGYGVSTDSSKTPRSKTYTLNVNIVF